MTTDLTRRRIAVVGSGISGLACAHVLGPHHDVVLYEADRRLGGHSNTVDIDDPVAGQLAVDTGFIVHNDRNYPNLVRLFLELGVTTVDTEMSFGVTDRDPASPTVGFTYRATNVDTLFADRAQPGEPDDVEDAVGNRPLLPSRPATPGRSRSVRVARPVSR